MVINLIPYERFRLEILLGNAEMRSSEDIAEALEATAAKLRGHQTAGKIMDVNGNSCGSYAVERVVLKNSGRPGEIRH